MGYKLGYHILVLPNQVLLINSVLTNEVLLYVHVHTGENYLTSEYVVTPKTMMDILKGHLKETGGKVLYGIRFVSVRYSTYSINSQAHVQKITIGKTTNTNTHQSRLL